jgi:glycosyltransferase involved in cell wall biosynthesis
MKNRIVIVGDTIGLPVGYAPSTRTINIALALSDDSRNKVSILLLKPSEYAKEIKNSKIKGDVHDIPFEYTCGSTVHSINWFGRRFQSLIGTVNAAKNIIKHRKSTFSVILYSRNIEVIIFLSMICRAIGIKTVLELCEWPETQPKQSRFTQLRKKLFCNYSLNFVDGVIYISQYIKVKVEEYEITKKRNIPKFHLPILCDAAEYDKNTTETLSNPFFLYCGNFSYQSLIFKTLESFALVLKEKPEYKMVLVGSSDNELHRNSVFEKVQQLGLSSQIELPGFVDREKLITLYKTAHALLLPLEDDAQSNARFPTKLSEYLLSGRPVVVSNVGEIPNHLTDNVSAFITKDSSVENFANRVVDAVENPIKAGLVGEAGRNVALVDFNYKTYSNKFITWINHL